MRLAQDNNVPDTWGSIRLAVRQGHFAKLDIVNLFGAEAERLIPKAPFEYISSGSGDEWTKKQKCARHCPERASFRCPLQSEVSDLQAGGAADKGSRITLSCWLEGFSTCSEVRNNV